MSLILDALRKSERSRQQTLSGRVSAAGSALDRGRVPVPWATLIGLLLIANVIVLGVIFWRSHAPQSPVPPTSIPKIAQPEAPPSAPAAVYRPAVRSLAAEAAATGPLATTGQTVTNPAPVVQPAAGRSAATTPVQATQTAATAASVSKPPAVATGMVPADDSVPLLVSLPLAFQQSFPALHLDVHGYTRDPASRFVVINMQRYKQGDTLSEGPTIVAIVANGVILEYHGQEFLLPRP